MTEHRLDEATKHGTDRTRECRPDKATNQRIEEAMELRLDKATKHRTDQRTECRPDEATKHGQGDGTNTITDASHSRTRKPRNCREDNVPSASVPKSKRRK